MSFDAATDGGFVNPATSLTFAHTVTGANPILHVGAFGETADIITGATYAGVPMTLIDKTVNSTDRFTYLFELVGPATGLNNVVISASGSFVIGGQVMSHTVAKQTAQPDAEHAGTDTNPGFADIITPVVDNCWIVLVERNNLGAPTSTTGLTVRVSSAQMGMYDSNGPITPAALYNIGLSGPVNATRWAWVVASIAPFVAVVSTSPTIVGPFPTFRPDLP